MEYFEYIIYNLVKFKILKKFGTSNPNASDNESIQTDTKSISSFNDSFSNVASSTSNNIQSLPTKEQYQQMEKDLAIFKEKFQTSEQICLTLSNDLNQLKEMYDRSKDNVKKLVQDKVNYEEKLQLVVNLTPKLTHKHTIQIQ
jgi:archaellum component FlaC